METTPTENQPSQNQTPVHDSSPEEAELVNNIRNCAKQSDEDKTLSAPVRARLEKEFFELVSLVKHYNTTRWTVTSFFMTVSFGVSGYFFSEAVKAPHPWLFFCSFVGPFIFRFAVALFRFHNNLIDSILDYLESLGRILGHYSPTVLRETNVKQKTERLFRAVFLIYLFLAPLFTILLLSPWPPVLALSLRF